MNTIQRTAAWPAVNGLQKVVVVNGTSEILQMLESVLDAGRYDMVFVESAAHAYSRVKRVQPNLVVLCMDIDDAAGFQLLSMLKLDVDTKSIPVVTYTTESNDADETSEEDDEDGFEDFPVSRPAILTMN